MKLTTFRSVTVLLGLALAATSSAAVVQGNSLQNGLNNISYADTNGNVSVDFYDVNADQISNDGVWNITATGLSAQTLIFEFAGFKNANSFGIYDIFNPSNTLQIFSGSEGAGAYEVIYGPSNTFTTLVSSGGTGSASFSSANFGYYLAGPGGMFYSQSHLNGGGADHLVAFQGNDSLYVDATGYGPGLFSTGEYILAWEDLPYTGSDWDYSDFVVMVESVTPVPAPGGLALFALALMGIGLARRRA